MPRVANATDQTNVNTNGPSLVSLFSPKYPPLAAEARITGEVEVKLEIQKDGSVESAEVVSGHPMLTQVALDSARQSRFACSTCTADLTTYSLFYSFTEEPGPDFPCSESHLHVTQTGNHVNVIGEPRMVYAVYADVYFRSMKCLDLWRCGRSHAWRDDHMYPVRSMKCLDLWNCGYQLREPYARCAKLHREIW